jgi:hypothetical protein
MAILRRGWGPVLEGRTSACLLAQFAQALGEPVGWRPRGAGEGGGRFSRGSHSFGRLNRSWSAGTFIRRSSAESLGVSGFDR